jgi:hypothetical protein
MMVTAIGIAGGAIAGFVVMAAVDPAQRSTHWDIWVISAAALIAGVLCYRLTRN